MKNIIVIEPEPTGHRIGVYVRAIVERLSKLEVNVLLVTSEQAIKHSAYKALIEDFPKTFETVKIKNYTPRNSKNRISLLKFQAQYWISIRRTLINLDNGFLASNVFIPYLDDIDKMCGLFGTPTKTHKYYGFLLFPKHHRDDYWSRRSSYVRLAHCLLFKRLLSRATLRKVFVFDRHLLEKTQLNFGSAGKIRLVNDVGEVRGLHCARDARLKLKIHPKEFTILVFGHISKAKNIQVLLESLIACGENFPCCVIFAGVQDNTSRALISAFRLYCISKNISIVELNWFVDGEQEKIVFSACDLVWVCYAKNFLWSSGVLFQASSVGKPVIGCDHGILGREIYDNQIGLTADSCCVKEISKKMQILYSNKALYRKFSANCKVVAKQHTRSVFSNRILSEIKFSEY